MIVVGLLGMASKFTECTLGVKYRTILPSGAVSGGPIYYLSRGMAERGFATLGKVLAVCFSVMVILGAMGAGTMFQGNLSPRHGYRNGLRLTAPAVRLIGRDETGET